MGISGQSPLHRDVDRGWAWVIAVAGCLIHIVVGGHRRSMGLFFLELLEYYDTSKSETAIVVSVFYVLSLSTAPIATMLTQRIPVRIVVGAGALSIGLAFVVAAFVKNFQVAILAIGAISGVGNAMIHAPTLVLVGLYFDKRRTCALGICLAGGALGAFIFPPIISLSTERYGFPGMMLMVGGMSLQAVIFAMLLRQPEIEPLEVSLDVREEAGQSPAEMTLSLLNNNELHPGKTLVVDVMEENAESPGEVTVSLLNSGRHSGETEVSFMGQDKQSTVKKVMVEKTQELNEMQESKSKDSSLNAGLWRRMKAKTILRQPAFYVYAVACALATEMLPLALYLIPPVCDDAGIGLEQQSLILLIMGAPDLLARLGIGIIADRFPKWRVDMFISFLILKALLWLFVTFRPDFLTIMVFAQMTGLIGGCIFTLYLPVLVDAIGVKNINLIFSVSLVFEGFFCLVFPPLLAYVREVSGSWIPSCRLMIGASLIAASLLLYDCHLLRRLRRCRRKDLA